MVLVMIKLCVDLHPVGDASLGRKEIVSKSRIPLGMHPYGMQPVSSLNILPKDNSYGIFIPAKYRYKLYASRSYVQTLVTRNL